jgi:N-methylhydantoinase B/oxoprolinase/acetone carboxylase alpha subunit
MNGGRAVEKKKLDPVTFEILAHRLEQIIAEAYYTISHVSGSAVVMEVGDHQR